MEPLKVPSYLPCVCLWSLVLTAETSPSPVSGLIFANVGDNMTMQCSRVDDLKNRFYWYKQTLGGRPRLLSTFYTHATNVQFKDEFQNDTRFSVDITKGNYHLRIANLTISDSATYYCTSGYVYNFQFNELYIVHVTGLHLNAAAEVHPSPSEPLHSGDPGTLNCTVHTGTCEEEHTVYWFGTSEESEPELIYAHGGRNDHCGRKNTTCFYSLSTKNLMSKTGLYYCAVTSCGRIVFGGGTKLDAENEAAPADHSLYVLTGALAFSTMLCVLLAVLLFKLHKRSSCQLTETQTEPSSDITEMVQEDNVHYAALRHQNVNKSRRKRESNECVYSSVTQ